MKTLLQADVPSDDHYRRLVACQIACPVHTDARGYVRAIAAGQFEEAYLIARGPNPFASICGRVCAAPCEAACRRGNIPRIDDYGAYVANDLPVAIRPLKRFVCELAGPELKSIDTVLDAVKDFSPWSGADSEEMAAMLRSRTQGRFVPADGQRVAIIGAGPAGLSAAHDLALMGFTPTVFESEPVAAGMLITGVPAYRLPREVIAREVAVIEALGVDIRCGVTVGRTRSFASLRDEYAAVIIAVGAKTSRALGLPGERGPRVYGGVDILRVIALGKALDLGHHIVVIGGGNVAYDVARTVMRQITYDTARSVARLPETAGVHLVSLETLEEMPADTIEIIEGEEEGIIRHNGWGPVEIRRNGSGGVEAVVLRRCLRVYDDHGAFRPAFDDSVLRTIPCDTVLLSVGQQPDLSFLQDGGKDIEMARPGWPRRDDRQQTTAPGVFVAGDLAHGTRLLIDAVASGKAAARSVYAYLTGRRITMEQTTSHLSLPLYRREAGYETVPRQNVPVLAPQARLQHPDRLVESGYNAELAVRESSRCLDCGVTPVFDGSRCVLCGGCVDVCPTLCLKLTPLSELILTPDLNAIIADSLGPGIDRAAHSAILKDEERCIRCGLCAWRCPTEAITMERVTFQTLWRSS